MTTRMLIRPEAVAGMFYPADAAELASVIDRYIAEARDRGVTAGQPKALIVPHAGYVFSGPIAASGYAVLAGSRETIERVILLGPAHRVPVAGMAVPSADAFSTPLGLVRIDEAARRVALEHPAVRENDLAHKDEHSLEVQLPFLQRVLGDVDVLPIVVGAAAADDIADVLDLIYTGPETLIVVSSDLCHYHDCETARRLDRATADAIIRGDIAAIGVEDACGAYPVRGLLVTAARHGLITSLVDLRNSGDTAGPPNSVVGYGAFTFDHQPKGDQKAHLERFCEAELSQRLLHTAAFVIDRFLAEGVRIEVNLDTAPAALREHHASFVTLERSGALLGCTGSMVPTQPLLADVAAHALSSAFADPRLPSVTRDDWHHMSIKISILSQLEVMDVCSIAELESVLCPRVDGLLISGAGCRGTFLPSVWGKIPKTNEFLSLLWRKAGLPEGAWPTDMVVERYRTVELCDPGPR